MNTVYIVWRQNIGDDSESIEAVYCDKQTAEYAVNNRTLEFRIEKMYVRHQERRIK